jgi:hypothetical protein
MEPIMGAGGFRCKAAIPKFRDIRGASKGGHMAGLKSLYDTDFLAWSKQQAEALRAALRNGSDQRLDLGNLAEEIDDLGKIGAAGAA